MVSTREWFDVTQGLLILNIFVAVIHAVLVRFSEDPAIVRDMVHPEDLEENVVGVKSDPLTCIQRAFWGMLYADDAGIVSTSAEGAKVMTVIVTVVEAAGLTVSEKKT